MKGFMFFLKFSASAWFIFGLYTMLTLTVGQNGKFAYEKFQLEHNKVVENLNNIKTRNVELNNIGIMLGSKELDGRNAIPADPETIKIMAREIGYGSPQDHFIRIAGRGTSPKLYMDPGEPLYAFRPNGVPDYILIVTAIFCGFGLFVCLTVHNILDIIKNPRSLKRRKAKPF
jgi:hypothetical protein